jgi:hypothetical protein
VPRDGNLISLPFIVHGIADTASVRKKPHLEKIASHPITRRRNSYFDLSFLPVFFPNTKGPMTPLPPPLPSRLVARSIVTTVVATARRITRSFAGAITQLIARRTAIGLTAVTVAVRFLVGVRTAWRRGAAVTVIGVAWRRGVVIDRRTGARRGAVAIIAGVIVVAAAGWRRRSTTVVIAAWRVSAWRPATIVVIIARRWWAAAVATAGTTTAATVAGRTRSEAFTGTRNLALGLETESAIALKLTVALSLHRKYTAPEHP